MKLLFLCVANSVRSQMAEGLARNFFGDRATVQSAGRGASQIHPRVIQALAEVGVDASAQRSKSVREIDPASVDTVITLCGEEVCPPALKSARQIHWPLAVPPEGEGVEDGFLGFRELRADIQKRLELLGRGSS